MKKQLTAYLVFAATAIASQPSWALGFGRVVPDAVLGQTLTFTVPVHVEPGERFGADCVAAQVYFGDAVLPPNQVRTSVDRGNGENQWVVRVTTVSPVVEPVVEIAVSAGCERRFERRFTAFADPPSLPAQPADLARSGSGVRMQGSSDASALAPVAGVGGVDGGGRLSGARGAGRSAMASGAAASRPRVIRKGPTMALANELRTPPAQRDANAAQAVAGKSRAAGPRVAETQGAAASHLVLDGGYSRLKLDLDEPMLPPPLSAAAAASMNESDDGDVQQLHALERSIQAMKKVDQSQREQTARLQAQLAEAQSDSGWMPWLLGLLALAVAAVAVLAWRLRQQAKLAHSAWFTESQVASKPPAAPAPAVVVRPAASPAPAVAPTLAADAGPVSLGGELIDGTVVGEVTDSQFDAAVDVSATAPLDRAALAGMMAGESTIPRELSVEELLDLEQQADFFIALGQEDAAVDLLMSHLRSAGGQSPLPYTKLLEIYRRQDDRSAYERTRARFNRRFNAYAPDWDTGPTAGRLLEDYPETIARVQAAWHAPIDAMAMLEALLFKREDDSELFDLPAYRDVLVLYSLARDLWQQEGSGATQVDVLLPLDDAAYPAFAAPAPYAEPAPTTEPVPLYGLDLPSMPDEPDSFVMTGYQPPAHEAEAGSGHADLELDLPSLSPLEAPEAPVHDAPVHLTLPDLGAFSLAPIEPPKPPAAPSLDWELGDPASSEPPPPKKR